jgi:hypothetical protein
MRYLFQAGRAIRRPEIEHHDFAVEVRKLLPGTTLKLPTEAL